MNVLYLTQFFSSSRGGAPLLFYDLARIMSERGHTVHVICNLSTERMNEYGNIVVHIVKPQLKQSNQLPPSIVQNLRYIINSITHGLKVIRENQIEIIHTNSLTPTISGSILSRLTGRPVIAGIMDVFTDHELIGWSNWAQFNNLPSYYSTMGRMLEKLSFMLPFDIYHTISQTTMHDILKAKHAARVRVIYPGIDVSKYNSPKDREYCDFILYIGRLVFYKNLEILLKTFSNVIQVIPHARLVVVGDGPMKERWQKMACEAGISRSVSFVGNIPTSEKIILLKKCSALALPSVYEGFGLVILEAFASAKPVLVSDVKPFDEIVDDGIDGFILPWDNPVLWSEKIQYLLLNKTICKKMGENALPKAYNKFSIEKSMDGIESLYRQVLSGQKEINGVG